MATQVASNTRPDPVDFSLGGPASDLSQAALAGVFTKFIAVQETRLTQIMQKLPARGQRFLQTLPQLLHENRPGLPGFVGMLAPAGIVGFSNSYPWRNTHRQSRAMQDHDYNFKNCEIHAVYLMGSAGSVAQTGRSDLDLWVCLPRSKHSKIRGKLDAIESYAASYGVELQAFAVDHRQFSSTTSSSAATSPLLLDEFYRSACWLAGAYPLWWLVPPIDIDHDYHKYSGALDHSGLLHPLQWVDFGPSATFTRATLNMAMTRTLQGAFTDPHKALLKAALIETYAGGAPPLSTRYKQNVLNHKQIDAYVLLADQLDEYYRQDPRLAILRQAWITKTGHKNAHLAHNEIWQQRVTDWGFSAADIEHFRHPEHWSMHAFGRANQALLKALRTTWHNHQRHIQSAVLPAQNLLQAQTLTRRLNENPTLLKPRPNHQGKAHVETTERGVRLQEHGVTLTEADHQADLVHWMVRRGFGLSALIPSESAMLRTRQLFDALTRLSEGWLINCDEDQDSTATLAQFSDPLSYGHQQRILLSQCLWVDPHQDQLVSRPVETMLLSLVEADSEWEVLGGLRRNSIHTHLQKFAAEARVALREPGARYLYALASDWVVISKTADGSYRSAQIPDLATVFTNNPSGAPLTVCSHSYQSTEARRLFQQYARYLSTL